MTIKKNLKLACILCSMVSVLTACAIPGVTEPFGASGNSYSNGDSDNKDVSNNNKKKAVEITDNIDETEFEQRYVPEGKTIYKVGDMVTPVRPLGDLDYAEYMHFKVNNATVYEHVSDAGLDESLIYDNWELFDGECAYGTRAVKNEDTMKARFLLCDMDIIYDKEYMDYITTDNVTEYSLIYVQDDGRYIMTGFPIYYSEVDMTKPEYMQNSFEVHEGTLNMQIGWVIDRDIFEVEKFDLSKLYICTAHDGDEDFQEFVDLGLKDE